MHETERSWTSAVGNGLRCRCPRCGKGKLYRRYLSLYDACPACGLNISQRPGDVLPAYMVISIVGLVLVGLVYALVMVGGVHPIAALAIGVPIGIALPLLLLPPVKGAVIGFQWAKGVQGFGQS